MSLRSRGGGDATAGLVDETLFGTILLPERGWFTRRWIELHREARALPSGQENMAIWLDLDTYLRVAVSSFRYTKIDRATL